MPQGYLAKGRLVDAGGVSNRPVLNTLAAAVWVETSMGGAAGTIPQMLA